MNIIFNSASIFLSKSKDKDDDLSINNIKYEILYKLITIVEARKGVILSGLIKCNNELKVFIDIVNIELDFKKIIPYQIDYEVKSDSLLKNCQLNNLYQIKFPVFKIQDSSIPLYLQNIRGKLMIDTEKDFIRYFSVSVSNAVFLLLISPVKITEKHLQCVNQYIEMYPPEYKSYIEEIGRLNYGLNFEIYVFSDNEEEILNIYSLLNLLVTTEKTNSFMFANKFELVKKCNGFNIGSAIENIRIRNFNSSLFSPIEITPLFPLPIFNKEIPYIENKIIPSFPFVEIKKANKNENNKIILGTTCYHGEKDKKISIDINQLTNHTLICGTTGSGKTRSCINILSQLISKKIPFMVIEPVLKNEYREFLNDNEVTIFTIGSDESPFFLNPFEVPQGVVIEKHISLLLACFAAAFPLWQPLPLVLEKAIKEIYLNFGWKLEDKVENNNKKRFPNLSHLLYTIPQIIKSLRYGKSEIEQNMDAALNLRIFSLYNNELLGRVLRTVRSSFSLKELFSRNIIFEIGYIPSEEHKALFMTFILTLAMEYHETQGKTDKLRHILVIEEAHRLLSNSLSISDNKETQVTANKYAIDLFSNALAEMRGFGEGIIIIDQTPSKLVSDVIKNTNLKIMHKIVSSFDREIMGESMNLDEEQKKFAGIMDTQYAIIHSGENPFPLYIKVNDVKALNKSSQSKIISKTSEQFKKFPSLYYCALCQSEACEEVVEIAKKIIRNNLKSFRELLEGVGIVNEKFLEKAYSIIKQQNIDEKIKKQDILYCIISRYCYTKIIKRDPNINVLCDLRQKINNNCKEENYAGG